MYQKDTLVFNCAAGLLARRFVTITPSTDTVAYTAAAAAADGITVGNESNLKIEVRLLNDSRGSFEFDAGGTIAVGEAVEVVGSVGKGTVQSAGIAVCYCKLAAVDGSVSEGYNKTKITAQATNVGVAETGSTAVELGDSYNHLTTLTVDTVLPAIAGGANLAVGKKLYTLPAGVKYIRSVYMSLAITQTQGHITADTPDGGLGTTIASGVVATLDGTPAFENVLTGQTFNDCDGTAEVAGGAVELYVAAAASHIIYFNVADGWAASGDAAAKLTGTVVIEWTSVA